ncbi:MAG TPA: hypothetical protein PLH49_11275, partial [Chitinophagaceae bacterium]|nr:hypothetical protein [Chitinophagaceae bacterium]
WAIYFFIIIFLLLCSLVAFFMYEKVTNNIYLASIERKVAILNQIAESGFLSKNELKPLYKDVAEELSKSEVTMINAETILYYWSLIMGIVSVFGLKFFSGAALGTLFFVVALFSSRDGKKEVMLGSLRLFMSFGFLGLILTTWISNFYSFLLLLFVQLVFLINLGRRGQRKLPDGQVV